MDVTSREHRLYIHARHEERQGGRTAFREFQKEYDLPNSSDTDHVKARLQAGVLYIHVPLMDEKAAIDENSSNSAVGGTYTITVTR